MIQSTTGIILRTQNLTESSLIVQWLSPDFGRISTVAKGARRPKSPFLGKLDLFYDASFSFAKARRGDLHLLREVQLLQTNVPLRNDIRKLRQAAYAAAFISQTTETETPLRAVFELYRELLRILCERKPSLHAILAFEIKMLQELGIEPDWTQTSLSAGTARAVAALGRRDLEAGFGVKLADSQTSELRQFLHGFIIFHLGKLPGGRGQALLNKDD